MIFRKIFLIFLLVAIAWTARASGPQCASLFSADSPFKKVPINLAAIYAHEKRSLTPLEIQNRNVKTLAKLMNYVPAKLGTGAAAVPFEQLAKLQQMTETHSVVGKQKAYKYDMPNSVLGFCFGRATFVHLILKMMGLQNESVFKIWAVGKMSSPEGVWDFHVATVAYTIEKGWRVSDTYFQEPVDVQEWVSYFAKENADGQMRIYITPAEKFGLSSGVYPRHELGLDLSRDDDWYKNYFVDMLKSIRGRSVRSLGLQKLNGPSLDDDTREIPPEWNLFRVKARF
jgi:hypothetical protein